MVEGHPAGQRGRLDTRGRRAVPVEVRAIAHSREELKRAAAPIRRLLESNPGLGLRGIVLPPDGSRVIVQADRDPATVMHSVPQIGVPVSVERASFALHVDTRVNDASPWSGGGRLNVSDGSRFGLCTAGFGVHDNAGNRYLLTAGHCGAPGRTTFSDGAGDYIGRGGAERVDLDIMLVPTYSANNMWDGGTEHGSYLRWLAGSADVYPGEHVCTSGSMSGRVCNIWVAGFYQDSYCGHDFYNNWECYHDLFLAYKWDGPPSFPGDSGGPVFSENASGYAIAKGTITGSYKPDDNGPWYLVFQDFVSAQRAFGVEVNLTL